MFLASCALADFVYVQSPTTLPQQYTKTLLFNPTNPTQLVSSGSEQGLWYLWSNISLDSTSQLILQDDLSNRETVDSTAFHPSGRYLAVGHSACYGTGMIEIWDLSRKPSVIAKLDLETSLSFVQTMDFSNDGSLLISGSETGAVLRVWNFTHIVNGGDALEYSRELMVFEEPPLNAQIVRAVHFHPDEPLLASADGAMIRLWDSETWNTTRSLQLSSVIRAMAISPDGEMIAVATLNGYDHQENRYKNVHLIRTTDLATVAILDGGPDVIRKLVFEPSGKLPHLFVTVRGGLRIWDYKTLTQVEMPVGDIQSEARALAFDGEGTQLAIGFDDWPISLWKVVQETTEPTVAPSTEAPTDSPTTLLPTSPLSTNRPTEAPSTVLPTFSPSTAEPSTMLPTTSPSTQVPTVIPSTILPTLVPSTIMPTAVPTTTLPTLAPSTRAPSVAPSRAEPSIAPGNIAQPSDSPSEHLSDGPTQSPDNEGPNATTQPSVSSLTDNHTDNTRSIFPSDQPTSNPSSSSAPSVSNHTSVSPSGPESSLPTSRQPTFQPSDIRSASAPHHAHGLCMVLLAAWIFA